MAVLIYIPTNCVQGFPFLYILIIKVVIICFLVVANPTAVCLGYCPAYFL